MGAIRARPASEHDQTAAPSRWTTMVRIAAPPPLPPPAVAAPLALDHMHSYRVARMIFLLRSYTDPAHQSFLLAQRDGLDDGTTAADHRHADGAGTGALRQRRPTGSDTMARLASGP